jgi:ATP-dependent RNA helicase RhlE
MNSESTFGELLLCAPLQQTLRELNYREPTPIQAQAIPYLLEGEDLLGSAQTGTGKTAAFSLPILHRFVTDPVRLQPHRFRALVLTPTRELAVQVAKSFDTYGKHVRFKSALVYGGVSAGPQIKAMQRGVDVLIATPGRLLDLHEQGFIDFGGLECFVLDEADRMLDMGFMPDIRRIQRELPTDRQSLFFSATFSEQVKGLASSLLSNPREVRIAPEQTTAESVDHKMCFICHTKKPALLQTLLDEQENREGKNLTLVFSRTKHGADRLSRQLSKAGTRSEAIHGDKSQHARQKALENFRKGRARILVATDVAARGIDIKDISLVVNYDLPNEPEAYVHRIGRTARAGAHGMALSFCTREELSELRAIEKWVRQEIPVHHEHEFHDEELATLKAMPFRKKSSARGGRRRPFNKQGFNKQGKSNYGRRQQSRRRPANAR